MFLPEIAHFGDVLRYKELQSNAAKMQKAMSTMASQLKEAVQKVALTVVVMSGEIRARLATLRQCSGLSCRPPPAIRPTAGRL